MIAAIDARLAEGARIAAILQDAGQIHAAEIVRARCGGMADAAEALRVAHPAEPAPKLARQPAAAAPPAAPTLPDTEDDGDDEDPEDAPPTEAGRPAPPPPIARRRPGKPPAVWTPQRIDRLREGWAEGEPDASLFAALNAMEGPPIASAEGVRKRAGKIGLRRGAEYLARLQVQRIAGMKAANTRPPPVEPVVMPPPAAAAPPPAPPPPAAPPDHAHQLAQAHALMREGHGETAIATRTGLPMIEARRLISEAKANARDLLAAGGLGTDDIVVMTHLPVATIRALRKEIMEGRAA